MQLLSNWTDGPCRSCLCLPSNAAPTKSSSFSTAPVAQCSDMQCPDLVKLPAELSEAFELETRPAAEGRCCPEIVRTSCKTQGGKILQVRPVGTDYAKIIVFKEAFINQAIRTCPNVINETNNFH